MIYVLCYESYRGGPILCINILIFENSYRMIKRELTINNNIVVSEFLNPKIQLRVQLPLQGR